MQTQSTVRSNDHCHITRKLQATKIRWKHLTSFEFPNSVHDILESDAGMSTSALPSVETCFEVTVPQVDLLTPTEERALFARMNCLKYLAAKRRNQGLSNGARLVDLRTVRNLLKEADAVRAHIAHANQRLALKIARSFSSNRDEIQDLIGEASLVLLKAIDGFDVSRGFRFSTYATHAIQRHLSRVRKRAIQKRHVTNDEQPIALEDRDEKPWVDAELAQMLPTLLKELDDRERELVGMRFGLGTDGKAWTYRDMATKVGLSSERVRQIVLQACNDLRRKYARSAGLDA